ncbi:hypothetical protein [Nocardiopsis alba]|uniref:hypothetical protein n=1 Tax=Nocardiopsis alba TaxID=53437 RepID=UPI0033A178CA
MPNIESGLREMMRIEGVMGAAVVDHDSGLPLGTLTSNDSFDLTAALAANTEVIRAKAGALNESGAAHRIEDMLITLSGQYHVIRPVTAPTKRDLFLYLVLERSGGDLASARERLGEIERTLEV